MHDPDPVEKLLTPLKIPPDIDMPSQELFDKTMAVLRGRRYWRRFKVIGTFLCCYIAGFLSMAALVPPRAELDPLPIPHGPSAPRGEPETPVLYRLAGDQCLEQYDPANAVRWYGAALDEGGTLEISQDDSWLLMAIKQARQKEIEECDR